MQAPPAKGPLPQQTDRNDFHVLGVSRGNLQHVDAVKVIHSLAKAVGHGLLGGAERHARVVVLLVGLLLALRVADLALEVIAVVGLVRADAVPEGPLRVGVDVHLDGAGLNGVADVLAGGAGATVEHEGEREVLLAANLLLDVSLGVVENVRGELDVARGVHAVHVAESSSDGEHAVGDLGEGLVHSVHLLRLGVEQGVVDVGVVNAILLAAGHAELHLEEKVGLGHALKVLGADLEVVLEGLLGQVKHVGAEQRLAVLLEVLLIGVEKTIKPGKPGLLAVIRVQDHGHAVELGDGTHVKGAGHAASDGGSVHIITGGLASVELATTAGELHDHGTAELLGGLKAGRDGARGHHVHRGDGELVVLGVLEQVLEGLASHDTRLHGSGELRGRREGRVSTGLAQG
mmetsp:Transcript_8381/g.24160  ORF Transcript_8381/g.24160 Transcript_8381/m.24160 type:complete len:403 (+) Transcript_8381:469-1677(+)